MSAKPTRRYVLATTGLAAAGAIALMKGIATRWYRPATDRSGGPMPSGTDISRRWPDRVCLDSGASFAESSRQAVHRFLDVEPDSLVDHLHQWRVRAAVYGGWAADEELRSTMSLALSHHEFNRRYPNSPPLIVRSPSGWEVRASTKNPDKKHHQSESHKDQLLAACGEIGVPAGQAIETDSDRISISDLIESSRRDFFMDQEAAWSVVAYCVYRPEAHTWKNRFGEEMTYDAIARRMIESDPDEGACAGAHTQYALTSLLRYDGLYGFLSYDTRRSLKAYLGRTLATLAAAQLPNGAWHFDWAKPERPGAERLASISRVDRLVHVTGHHLEWISLLPSSFRAVSRSVLPAARFALRTLQESNRFEYLAHYCPFSHSARSLALLACDAVPRS